MVCNAYVTHKPYSLRKVKVIHDSRRLRLGGGGGLEEDERTNRWQMEYQSSIGSYITYPSVSRLNIGPV